MHVLRVYLLVYVEPALASGLGLAALIVLVYMQAMFSYLRNIVGKQ